MNITPVNNVLYFRGKTTNEAQDKEKRKEYITQWLENI